MGCREKLTSNMKKIFLLNTTMIKKFVLKKIKKAKNSTFKDYQKIKRKILPLTASKCLVCIGFVFLGIFLLSPFYSQVYRNYQKPESILVTYSQLLTTIFAITFSITLLGIQYLAQKYTPRSIRQYFNDPFFSGFIGVYLFAITLNIMVSSFSQFLPSSLFVFPSFILLLFCLFYLIAYPFNVIKKLQPSDTLKRIDTNVPKNLFKVVTENRFWSNTVSDSEKEPFIVLEQVTIQSIRNNDYSSYVNCLDYFNRVSFDLIEEAKKEYVDKQDLGLLASRTDSILAFIYVFFEQVRTEVFQTKNELFILSLLYRIEKIIILLHSAKGIRALRGVYKIHEAIGRDSIKADFEYLTEQYCRSIERITKVEMKAIEGQSYRFEPPLTDYHKQTEAQKKERTFNRIMYGYFESRIHDKLVDTVKIASEKGFGFSVFLLISIYSDIYDKVIELKSPHMFAFLISNVTWNLEKAYKYASENNIHESYTILGDLDDKVEKIEKSGHSSDYSKYLTLSFCQLALLNIEKDDYGAIWVLGQQGRTLVKKYPSLVLIILEILGKALKMVSKSKRFNRVSKQNIKTEIDSIQRFNKNNYEAIKEKVSHLLKEDFSEKKERGIKK